MQYVIITSDTRWRGMILKNLPLKSPLIITLICSYIQLQDIYVVGSCEIDKLLEQHK